MQSLLLSVMRIGLVTVALFSCYALSTAAWADVHGRVVAVQDGDTLTVLDQGNTQHRIRVAGIDAPEKRQAFGVRSKEALAACAFAKPAVVETRKQDRYGRTVGLVKVGGEDCGLRQVRLGLAWHYKAYEREQSEAERNVYSQAEMAARGAGVGLWKDPSPEPPWSFRQAGR